MMLSTLPHALFSATSSSEIKPFLGMLLANIPGKSNELAGVEIICSASTGSLL
jgi:hypothetical protein